RDQLSLVWSYPLQAPAPPPGHRLLPRPRSLPLLPLRLPRRRNPSTIRFFYSPPEIIPPGACASDKKVRNAWIALGIRPSLSILPKSLTTLPVMPGPTTPRTLGPGPP